MFSRTDVVRPKTRKPAQASTNKHVARPVSNTELRVNTTEQEASEGWQTVSSTEEKKKRNKKPVGKRTPEQLPSPPLPTSSRSEPKVPSRPTMAQVLSNFYNKEPQPTLADEYRELNRPPAPKPNSVRTTPRRPRTNPTIRPPDEQSALVRTGHPPPVLDSAERHTIRNVPNKDGSITQKVDSLITDWSDNVPEHEQACNKMKAGCTRIKETVRTEPVVPFFVPSNTEYYSQYQVPVLTKNMSSYQAFTMAAQLHGRPVAETGTLIVSTPILSSVPSESIRFESEWHLDTGYYFVMNKTGHHVASIVVCNHYGAPNFITAKSNELWNQWNPLKFPLYAETYDFTSAPSVMLHFVSLSNNIDCGEYRLVPTPYHPKRPLIPIHLTRQETPFGYPTHF